MSEALRATRVAVEVVGWLFLLTIALGGVTLTANFQWKLFASGGLWIGLPIAIAAWCYAKDSTHER